MKKGQVTIYIIIGLVLVISVLAVLSLRYNLFGHDERGITSAYEFQTVSEQINLCIEERAFDSIVYVSGTGGYYFPPQECTDLSEPCLAYHYISGDSTVPSKGVVEQQISYNLIETIPSCIDYLNDLQDDVEVSIDSDPIISVDIQPEAVFFDIQTDIVMKSGKLSHYEKEFQYEVDDIRLYDMLQISERISQQQEARNICVSCLAELSDLYDVDIDFEMIDDNTNVFSVIDRNLNVGESVYIFNFAHYYE